MLDPDGELRRMIELDKQMRELDPLRNVFISAERMRKLTKPIERLNASLKPIEDAIRDDAAFSRMIVDIVHSSIGDRRPFNDHFQELTCAEPDKPRLLTNAQGFARSNAGAFQVVFIKPFRVRSHAEERE